ncbi:hypothetical protein WJX73_005559 [Symbiochloris irregularis]|uniref:Glycosyl hydrolase family 32 N-terminal domain-containing protein n=1 Tax=Symbiochloris irregularis TaxID=706552 RepID=A0AAW1NYI7_9CHLO
MQALSLQDRFSPVAPVLNPDFDNPGADWLRLFKVGQLPPVGEGEWDVNLGPYGKIDKPQPEPVHGFDCMPDAHIDYDKGGRWLNQICRLNREELVGFFHAEYPFPKDEGVHYKLCGVFHSTDEGASWSEGGPCVSAGPPGDEPRWGGTGDHSCIWDPFYRRWLCYFTHDGISLAKSEDPRASIGTWKKWNGDDFSGEGLDGPSTVIEGLNSEWGSNPSIHFNTLLQRWVMLYANWPGKLFVSTSTDAVHWEPPRQIAESIHKDKDGNPLAVRYPTVISAQGEAVAGASARLYYADFDNPDNGASRDFVSREITFTRRDGRHAKNAKAMVCSGQLSSMNFNLHAEGETYSNCTLPY